MYIHKQIPSEQSFVIEVKDKQTDIRIILFIK